MLEHRINSLNANKNQPAAKNIKKYPGGWYFLEEGNEMEGNNQVEMARLEERIAGMEKTLNKIDSRFEILTQTYIPREEVKEMFRARDKEIDELKSTRNNGKNLWATWAGVAIAAVAVIVALWPSK